MDRGQTIPPDWVAAAWSPAPLQALDLGLEAGMLVLMRILGFTALFYLCAMCARAQVEMSFSQQGPEFLRSMVGRVIPGEQVLEVTVCSNIIEPMPLSGGEIYQAAAMSGIATISKRAAPSIFSRQVQRSIPQRLLDLGKLGALGAAFFGTGGFITMSKTVIGALVAAHGASDQLAPALEKRVPDPTPLLNGLIDATEAYVLPASGHGCFEGFVLAKFAGTMKPFRLRYGTSDMGQPAPAVWRNDPVISHRIEMILKAHQAGL